MSRLHSSCPKTMACEAYNPHEPYIRKQFQSSLAKFKQLIKTVIDQNTVSSKTNLTEQAYINYKEFHDTVASLFGSIVKTEDIEAFYTKIVKHPETRIDWTEVFGCSKTKDEILPQLNPENSIFFLAHRIKITKATGAGKNMRDTIQCIVKVPLLDAVLTVSQKGTISLFNSQMNLHSIIHASESSWFVGCDFLNQLGRVVAVTTRSIVVWDYKCHAKDKDNYICIKPMEHCLLSVCSVTSEEESVKDEILLGDDGGYVSLYSIGTKELNIHHNSAEKLPRPVVLDSSLFQRFRRKLHTGWVLKVKHFPELNCFASCSPDSNVSLVLDRVNRIKDDRPVRIFSIPRGVNTFAYSVRANMIVTGGDDKRIRLWHKHDIVNPMAILSGHKHSIADITINERDQHVISVSSARMFRIWDIETLSLLQVLSDTEKGPSDIRINSMIFDNKHLKLITGSCYLQVLPLTRMVQASRLPCSHDWPVNTLVYNKEFNEALSICSGSVLKVWDMDTGCPLYQIIDPHGPNTEVTAAAVDKYGLHYATGACNGSLKIQNWRNGSEVKALPAKEENNEGEQGFSQMIYLRTFDNQHVIFALDMSGKIKAIQGKEDDTELFVTMEFYEDFGMWFRTLHLENDPKGYFPTTEILVDLKYGEVKELESTASSEDPKVCFDSIKLEDHILLASGSISGEINLFSLDTCNVRHIYSRNNEDVRINTILCVLMKASSSDPDFRCKKLMGTSDMVWGLYLGRKDDRTVKVPSEPVDNSWCSVQLDGQPVFPFIASGHENGRLCLWNTEGDLVSHVLVSTRHFAVPLTALCTDKWGTVMFAGNEYGYIIFSKLQSFEDSTKKGSKAIKQQLYWKAHNLEIVSLVYKENSNIVASASADGSIRLWHASNGNYIGHFGQKKPYTLTDPYESILPCDIREIPVRSKPVNIMPGMKDYKYPLVYNEKRLNLIINKDPEMIETTAAEQILGLKYFRCMSSPKMENIPYDGLPSHLLPNEESDDIKHEPQLKGMIPILMEKHKYHDGLQNTACSNSKEIEYVVHL